MRRRPDIRPAFFFREKRDASHLARRGGVAAEDAEFAGGVADFR